MPPIASTSGVTLDASSASTSKPFKDPVFGGSSPKIQPAAAVAAKAQPRFDPQAPGAVVMKRPNAAQQKRHNSGDSPIVDVVVDPYISKKLRPHQIECACFFCSQIMQAIDNSD